MHNNATYGFLFKGQLKGPIILKSNYFCENEVGIQINENLDHNKKSQSSLANQEKEMILSIESNNIFSNKSYGILIENLSSQLCLSNSHIRDNKL